MKITLSIDSSSTVSGVALFKDNELVEHCEVIHGADAKMEKEDRDLHQHHIQLIVDKLVVKYCGDVSQVEEFNILIEQPRGSFSNNRTYGRLCFYAGLWLGKITSMVSAIDGLYVKTKFHRVHSETISREFKFHNLTDKKIQALAKVKELYGIDLIAVNVQQMDQYAGFKRDKQGNIKSKIMNQHNAADAILIGHWFLNK